MANRGVQLILKDMLDENCDTGPYLLNLHVMVCMVDDL